LERYQEEKTSDAVAVYERSLESGRGVFLEGNRQFLDPRDYVFLRNLSLLGEDMFETSGPALSVYLTCSEQEMKARHKMRARPSERNLRRVNLFII
jgi:deoxyadenosine/deoxycytidine kinase